MGHLQFAEMLLSKGANVNQAENEGWTPLHLACDKKEIRITQLLLDHPSIDVTLAQRCVVFYFCPRLTTNTKFFGLVTDTQHCILQHEKIVRKLWRC